MIILTKESGDIIGSSRFKLRPNFKNAAEIGWSFLARKYWGGQYNGEVKRLMMEYAFQHVDRILFFVDKDNRRSQKAVEKLGSLSLKVDRKVESGNDDITYIIQKVL
ncbi:GNAT family N-acetyltransferase [Flagellimonas onchidii]|uniref:GNAT family N-acetyltransferase n=1 Tax=Flagellimonas onchidii TaxID=2562684 RepID=UPI001455F3BB|nr:GNAT family N-acetyltransferase [Allomuricauda onchidii]